MLSDEQTPQITEALITNIVHTFYDNIRKDDLLGPIFDAKIRPHEWDAHLNRMVDFWSSVILTTGRYAGRPHALHQPLPITQKHFAHWLTLFDKTLQSLCPPDIAALFLDRAQRIAQSLQAGMGLFPYAQYP